MQTLLEKRDVSSEELTSLLQARTEGKVNFILIDVRENMEYNMGHIKGVDMLKPTTSFQQWGQALFNETQDKTLIFTCRTGNRSGQIQNVFSQNGHKNVINHSGGIMAFSGEVEK